VGGPRIGRKRGLQRGQKRGAAGPLMLLKKEPKKSVIGVQRRYTKERSHWRLKLASVRKKGAGREEVRVVKNPG